MSTPENRLESLGLTLPKPMAAVANYVPFVITGNLLFVSGQVSIGADGPMQGCLGADLGLEEGQAAAKLCGLNLIAQCEAATGNLSRIKQVVKLCGFVSATPEFKEIPQVINGCSDLMVDVFGDKGRHSRTAVSAPVLPLGFAVEVDGVFALE